MNLIGCTSCDPVLLLAPPAQIVRLLVEVGGPADVEVNRSDDEGWTPLLVLPRHMTSCTDDVSILLVVPATPGTTSLHAYPEYQSKRRI